MKIWTAIVSLLFSSSLLASASPWVDFNISNGSIRLPVEVNGQSTHAIVDTGADREMIAQHLVNKIRDDIDSGPSMIIQGVFGESERRTFDNVNVAMFGSEVSLSGLVEGPMSDDVGLIIGRGLFSQFVVQIDYPNQKMRLVNRDSIDVRSAENIEAVGQKGSGRPIVKVTLNNGEKAGWFLFDTGSFSGLLVQRRVAASHDWLSRYPVQSIKTRGVNEVADAELFQLPQVQLGPYSLEGVITSVADKWQTINLSERYQKEQSRIKGKRIEGLIGYDILKHFVITIDYAAGDIHLGLPE